MVYEILWKIHAVLMSSSFLALASGIFISLVYKKMKWRYKTHKYLGIYAGLSGFSALVIALIMVQIFNGVHFTSRHAVFGAFTGILLILTPLAGLSIVKVKNKKRMKMIHRISGYSTLILMIITIYYGLEISGIIYMFQ